MLSYKKIIFLFFIKYNILNAYKNYLFERNNYILYCHYNTITDRTSFTLQLNNTPKYDFITGFALSNQSIQVSAFFL